MIARSCAAWRSPQRPCQRFPLLRTIERGLCTNRSFHSSRAVRNDEVLPNHYETLALESGASPAEIKKQFYKLSKSYHPDLHPNDPSASERFVKISEAYATLSSPDKKARYDRDFERAYAPHSSPSYASRPSGSFSSASTPAGGRPASGLSRRRTQFRGPPPSFYRAGGWGQYGDKRSAAANEGSHSQAHTQEPGTGPGGFAAGFDNDVSHFDHRGHYRTHSEIERNRHRARRKQDARVAEAEMKTRGGGGTIVRFIMVSGVIILVITLAGVAGGLSEARNPHRSSRQKADDRA